MAHQKYCIWLCNDSKISSLFPSYLLKAFHINASYTTNILEANLVIGGRNLLRLPEHYSGIVLGAGADRKIVRSFPLMRIISLLGQKTSECVLSVSTAIPPVVGDPLLLSEIVYTRLQQTPGVHLAQHSCPPLFLLQSAEEVQQCRQWKWMKQAEESKDIVLQDTMHIVNTSMLEVMEIIATSKCVFSNDPDVLAIALSFNVACCPVTLKSADLFVWKDLFSAFPQQLTPTVKRLKDDTTLKEALSWCQARPVGELKVLKTNLMQQLEKLRGGTKVRTISPRDCSIPASKLPPKRSKSLSRLSQTQVFKPQEQTTRLHPTWVKPKPVIPPLPLNLVSPSPSSSSSSSSASSSLSTQHLPPPLPATLLSNSAASTPHVRNRNSRKIISNETPRS